MSEPAVSVVILTRGDRSAELHAAVASALDQRGVSLDVLVVANGCPADSLGLDQDDRVRVIESASNLGIPGGRNLGGRTTSAPVLAFLDDDASYLTSDVLGPQLAWFEEDPSLAVVAQRIVDERGVTARRHVPRLGSRGADRSGPVAAFLGGAVLIRRSAFLTVGGYVDEFTYSMEETDLSWRLIDAGWRIRYDGRPAVRHPATEPTRHAGAVVTTMRNRVWMAHRCLPVPLAVGYVAAWLAVSGIRSPRTAGSLLAVVFDAWPQRPGPRRPIAWRTAWRLTRLGRPPVV